MSSTRGLGLSAVDANDHLIFHIETLWMQVGPFLGSFAGLFGGDLSGILDIDFHAEALAAPEKLRFK